MTTWLPISLGYTAFAYRPSWLGWAIAIKLRNKGYFVGAALAAMSVAAKAAPTLNPESVTSLRHRTQAIDSAAVKKIPA